MAKVARRIARRRVQRYALGMPSLHPDLAIQRIDPADPAARACLDAYFDLLAQRIDGIPRGHVPNPDPEADSFRPPKGAFLLATGGGGVALGCVSLKTLHPDTGEVKRLWVAPEARGMGLGRRLMAAVEDEARALGLSHLWLDTNAALTEAIAMYHRDGWHDITPYTGWPATHWFGKAL